MKFKRITQRAAFRIFREGSDKLIWLCPCKLRPDGPFSNAVAVSGKACREEAERLIPASTPNREKAVVRKAWDLMTANWVYYNTSYEAGYYPHYYINAEP